MPVDPGDGTILFGGSGFLGSAILRNFPTIVSVGRTKPRTANRHIPIVSVADLSCLRDLQFDRVIFIIGHSDRDRLEKDRLAPGEPTAYDYHVAPLLQALEQLKDRPLKKFIHFSTILLYDEQQLPVAECAPVNPHQNRYVFSKYLAEEACKYYGRSMPILTLRLSNMFGPSPPPRYDLIHRVCSQLLDKGCATIRSRKPERDFIYVEDVVQAVGKLLDTDVTGTLNMGSGTISSVGRVMDILSEISGCGIRCLDEPVDGPMRFQCDMTALHRVIDWTPGPLEDGLRSTFLAMKDGFRA